MFLIKSHKFLPDAPGSIKNCLVQLLLLKWKFLYIGFLHAVTHFAQVHGWARNLHDPVLTLVLLKVFVESPLDFLKLLCVGPLTQHSLRVRLLDLLIFLWNHVLRNVLLSLTWAVVSIMAVFVAMIAHHTVVVALIFLHHFIEGVPVNLVLLTVGLLVPERTTGEANRDFIVVMIGHWLRLITPIFLVREIRKLLQGSLRF